MPITTGLDLLDGQLYYPGGVITLAGSRIESSRTGINAMSATVIPFGFGVVKGTGEKDLILPVDGNSVFLGVAKQMEIEKRAGYSLDASDRFGCPIDHELTYLEAGDIAVYVDGNVVAGSPVYLRHTANSSVVGTFRGDVDTSNAVLIAGARWLGTVTGATGSSLKLAPLRINRP